MQGEIETHPFGEFIPSGATHLILGSFPTHSRNWQFESFYPGRANFFWRMLSEIYHHPFQFSKGKDAANERLALCTEKGIGLSDTIYRCRRKVVESSKDSDLEVIERKKVLALLKSNPSLHTIILTGSSGKVSALSVLAEYLSEHGVSLQLSGKRPPMEGLFSIYGRKIQVHVLYSTSGLNIGRYSDALAQYKTHLPK
jgi:G:T/U-mismatch repair DNA glycosylase